jgi:thiol-disulfide isomerase/thioredoxin
MTDVQSPPSRARIWWYVAIGFASFWMFCLYYFVPVQSGSLENSGMSEPAEFNWSLLDLNDRPVSFSKFKGKTVFLNFWATWCGPCVREMPSIAKLAKNPRLRGKEIAFVCVSTDSSSEVVRSFLEGSSWDMTFLRVDKVPPVYTTDGIPATFLIAADGRIAASSIGAADWSEPHVVEVLEKLARPAKAAQ